MPRERQDQDPYAPPPRYKMKGGALVRVALIAAMLGLGVWGYTQFNDPNAPPLVAEEQSQQVAENRADGGYNVTPAPDATTAPQPAPAPATPAPAAPQAAPAAPASEPVPSPSTTIGGEAGR
jgi:cytoskeletal protein RodZ